MCRMYSTCVCGKDSHPCPLRYTQRLRMRHDTSRIWPKKLHSRISLMRVSKLVFDHFFANVGSTGPALALEVANIRMGAQGAARTIIDW